MGKFGVEWVKIFVQECKKIKLKYLIFQNYPPA